MLHRDCKSATKGKAKAIRSRRGAATVWSAELVRRHCYAAVQRLYDVRSALKVILLDNKRRGEVWPQFGGGKRSCEPRRSTRRTPLHPMESSIRSRQS